MDLQTNLKTLGGGYALQAKKLEKLGIKTILDLLYHIPSRYEDLRIVAQIKGLRLGEIVTIQGEIISIKNEYRTRFMSIQKAVVKDKTSEIECRWFNQAYIPKTIPEGTLISISGTVGMFGRVKCISVKEFEIISDTKETIHTGRLVPVYPLTRGLSSKWLRTKIFDFLYKTKTEPSEFLPEQLLLSNKLPELKNAISNVHFPKDFEEVALSIERLSYEELFLVQLGALVRRKEWEKEKKAPEFQILKYKKEIDKLISSLPFTLTNAQVKALDDIYADLAGSTPMNRLLEGDVGSGKTVVAAIAMYVTFLNGYQSVFMAPTEILANQHYEVLSKVFKSFGLHVELVTRNSKIKDSKSEIDILVGTHSVLNSKIEFKKLGLVIIDEQQRFGVEQRGILRSKGQSPHFLTMTATPIPRTVFLTLYGDLSLSVLDEMPAGRVRVKTWLVPNKKRAAGYEWIKTKILEKDENGQGNQAFIVCPFIEESESSATVKAATTEFDTLSKKVFKGFRMGLLHGKMKGKEKNAVLSDFSDGKIDILVATPVVEVGIDIPNATIMVIEAAERFGLSQLHQLRGRVGRRSRESYCLLYTEVETPKTQERLKALESIYIGALLAELDLKLRGPGDMYGRQQHGGHFLKIASFSDFDLIVKTKKDAQKIFPILSSYPNLQTKLKEQTTDKILPD